MLGAERAHLVDGLLLLSYPLHPPRKPDQLRTHHFAEIRTPALFVHGTRDPFGSIAEMELALRLIRGEKALLPVEGAGHDLKFKGKTKPQPVPGEALQAFQQLLGNDARQPGS
jgi:hypothetical protein